MNTLFSSESEAGKTLAEWWLGLRNDRGARADLRRCESAVQVEMTPAFQRLCYAMREHLHGTHNWEARLAAVVGLAAHLKPDAVEQVLAGGERPVARFAELMAQPNGDRPTVSQLRFRRLLQRDRTDLYPNMIRILRIMDGRAPLYGLAESVFYWNDRIRKQWAYAYFPKAPETKSA